LSSDNCNHSLYYLKVFALFFDPIGFKLNRVSEVMRSRIDLESVRLFEASPDYGVCRRFQIYFPMDFEKDSILKHSV